MNFWARGGGGEDGAMGSKSVMMKKDAGRASLRPHLAAKQSQWGKSEEAIADGEGNT